MGQCTEDYVFLYDGRDVGRAYGTRTPDGDRWLWTVYSFRSLEGVPNVGLAATLDEAKSDFKASYERLMAGG